MEQQTLGFIKRHGMTHPGNRVLVAVSGGADSTALLCILHRLSPALGICLHVAHVDHTLRPSSGQEAEKVEALCRELGVPCTLLKADVPALMARQNQSMEVAARNARWSALRAAAAAQGCAAIATAHHRGDQAETVLLRLIRGAGAPGCAAMAPVDGDIIRPLLWADHASLQDYLRARSIAWCEDESNLDITIPRNYIRHRVLPDLAALNPSADRALARTAALLAQDEDYFSPLVEQAARAFLPAEGGVSLPLQDPAPHPALMSRLLRRMARELGCRELPAACVESGLSLAAGNSGHSLCWPGGLTLRREQNALVLTREVHLNEDLCVPLCVPGQTRLPGLGYFICRILPYPPSPLPQGLTQCFDAGLFPQDTVARTRLDGDRIHKLGTPGETKLKKVMMEGHISRWARDRVPLVAAGSRVLWAAGLAREDDTRVTPSTGQTLIITWIPEEKWRGTSEDDHA